MTAGQIREMARTNTYGGFAISDLEAAFKAVSNPQDWKGPIAAIVNGEVVSLTVTAIEFYTATTPSISLNTKTMQYIIESEGYRAGPAGDH